METTTLSLSQPATQENRRAARMRKVRPVAFVPRAAAGEPALRTVTANVSRGGMLLVTRQDDFPPAGASVLLMPFEVSGQAGPDSGAAIQGRIVYTRYSPRARLRFAGLKFEQELPARAAQMLGLDGRPDAVTDAITTLEELEAMSVRPAISGAARMEEMEIIARAAERIVAGPEERLGQELASARAAFLRATGIFLGEWGEARIRETLGARHALARAKGVDGLREMKREWIGLRANLDTMGDAIFERSGVWPREMRGPIAEDNPYYNGEREQPRAGILEGLRRLAGEIGRLLVRQGFDDVGAGTDWALIPGERGALTYAGAIPFSDGMREALACAAAVHDELIRARNQRGALRETEARQEALRIWERA